MLSDYCCYALILGASWLADVCDCSRAIGERESRVPKVGSVGKYRILRIGSAESRKYLKSGVPKVGSAEKYRILRIGSAGSQQLKNVDCRFGSEKSVEY